MAYMGQFKNSEGHYYAQKKKKRDRVTGLVPVPGTPVILQGQFYTTGPFIAETIEISNPGIITTFQLFDGVTPLTAVVNIAANALVTLTPVWMPFFTSVRFDAGRNDVRCTMGGWIP